MRSLEYLSLLGKQYKNVNEVTTEIINLQAILNLPKGSEYFLTDLHGEYEGFSHYIRSASGTLKFKIEDIFSYTLSKQEKEEFGTLIYYPEEKLKLVKKQEKDMVNWYEVNIFRLIKVCKVVSSKYTRSKLRKALPENFKYILEELLNIDSDQVNTEAYYFNIIDTIIELDRSEEFIIAISYLIQRLLVDKLHIVGDIFDRGPSPHLIMDELITHHNVDIQWGNHDLLWMGASLGHRACVATALRIALRYGNLGFIEAGYGINLLPLGSFAMRVYKDDPCKEFMPKGEETNRLTDHDVELISKMHKAIAIIQFKLEGQIIKRKPCYEMEHMLLLDKIDHKTGVLKVDGKTYKLTSNNFPTVDPKDPYRLTDEEEDVIERVSCLFKNSEKLDKHVGFLYSNGSLYKTYNGNLLYHGCMVVDEKGEYTDFTIGNKPYAGKVLLDKFEEFIRAARYNGDQESGDWLWYLWSGKNSPMFAKHKMATFERYFTTDKEFHKEILNPYFSLRGDEKLCKKILETFGLDPENGHIICGHTPVKYSKGESPIKANGKLLVIDGGVSRAYQKQTGLAGYTLIYNSWGLKLVSHMPFESCELAVKEGINIRNTMRVIETTNRKKVADTDIGKGIKTEIRDLKELLKAYRNGKIKEQCTDEEK